MVPGVFESFLSGYNALAGLVHRLSVRLVVILRVYVSSMLRNAWQLHVNVLMLLRFDERLKSSLTNWDILFIYKYILGRSVSNIPITCT